MISLILILSGTVSTLCFLAIYATGSLLSIPSWTTIKLLDDLDLEYLHIQSSAGSLITASWLEGNFDTPVILIMHDVRAHRSMLIYRTRFLNRLAYSVLLFDFQAHGESAGVRTTFGHLERKSMLKWPFGLRDLEN